MEVVYVFNEYQFARNRVYYKEAVGAFIVFDVTRQATFDAVKKWKQDLDGKVQLPDGSNIPCMLLANKVREILLNIVTYELILIVTQTITCPRYIVRPGETGLLRGLE